MLCAVWAAIIPGGHHFAGSTFVGIAARQTHTGLVSGDPLRPSPTVRGRSRARYRGRAVSKRILVVDDKADLLSLMRMLLEDERYHVSVLQQGRDAAEQVRTAQPDLVILDLKLEDANGLDILHQLKGQHGTSDIPVIVYSAAVIEAEQVANLIADDPAHYGNVSVLQKPFELDALLERVYALLGAAEPS